MNLKTEAQLTQELSEVWRLLEAERTGFSRIIAEKDKEIERLKKDSDRYRYRKLRRMHCMGLAIHGLKPAQCAICKACR